ncbi:MAG TPA: 50S ribosomal protein L11 methyltransferase [Geminicoccaceae bacterium]|nr:50S ribosomal protein L11 methyltransferase [Geminicoccaceae bacterium]
MSASASPAGPAFTAGELWRVAFSVPDAAVAGLLEPLDDLALSVSLFEESGDGGFVAETWRVELLLDSRPELRALRRQLQRICAAVGTELGPLTVEPLPEEDWLAAARRETPPIAAGPFVVHGSHARDQVPAGRIGVQIDAGLAFGSGEHGSTRGCLEALAAVPRRPRRVLDMGTGSGVLAIAAAKRWPTARVLAVDNDPIAVRIALENARLNGVAMRVRTLASEGYDDLRIRRAAPFELILANILADALIQMAGDLARHLAPGGRAVLSGLLDRQAEAVLAAHASRRLRPVGRIDHGPWATLTLERVRR